ncbi:MAG TPA: helicase-exonuclease AddAB subunit AddB [Syntrophomonadaceae bacterium]|nr:helicase-exonuclease AddAB subunit AddB [Syntrophomonadaceae bacterium]HPR93566.1 helicase-exonuclease AddAB subunit AddB [Syntrophomonadaceae bacterium]
MAIRYVFGRAGIAGTDYIISEIAECLRAKNDQPLYLLVPEQLTLESEKNLIRGIGSNGIIHVEVLSFNRLAFKVLNEAGGRTLNTLNEQGKSMILRKIVAELSPELDTFAGAARKAGFINIISDCLSDFKSNNINSDMLQQYIDGLPEDRMLTGKLKDLLLIFRSFDNYMQDSYIDTEDHINLVTAKLAGTSFLQNARIWIDGFDKFSPQLLKMLAELARLCQHITVSLTMGFGSDDRDGEIFNISRQTYNKIHALALELGIEEEIINLNRAQAQWSRKKKPELAFLERELFAYPYDQYTDEINDMQVFAAANIKSEIENVTAEILALVREKDYRFRDIMIACTDMERYSSLIRQAFSDNNIPFFMDEKRGIMNNPIIESILASLQIIIKGYRGDEVFRFLKAGFSNLDHDQCDELENYVLRYGIRGTIWKKPFTIDNGEPMEQINAAREMFINPLKDLERSVKGNRTCGEMAAALYEYLEEIKLQEKIEAYIAELSEQKQFEYVNENTQIWNIVMMILDQTVEFLGEETASLKEFADILEAGFASFEIGIIPTTIDEVTVGSVSRSKSHGSKALFLIGANDGFLPARPAEHELLSEEEITAMKDNGIDIGFDPEYRLGEANFNIYETLAKAHDHLWISYALADDEGKPLHQSIIVDRLQMIFPALKIEKEQYFFNYQNLNMIGTPEGSFEPLILNLKDHLAGHEIETCWWDVYDWYYRNSQWQDRLAAVLAGFGHNNQQNKIDAALAGKLYKTPLKASVSRLETFNGCQFAHFIHYGLKPQERKVFELGAPDIGELFHLGLVTFARQLNKQNITWKNLEQEECFTLMDGLMDDLVREYKDGILNSSPRYKYLVQRLKRICRRAVWTLTLHLKRGEFMPAFYEVSFGARGLLPPIEIELDSGEKVYLEGRIDRIDLLEASGSAYVKVIDYKSGYQDINLSDIYNGFSLQLIIYLYSVLQAMPSYNGKQAKPAGIFYFKIDDPMVTTESQEPEAIEKEIFKKLKMAGLVLKDVNIIRKMDIDLNGYSEILPVQVKKDDEIAEKSNALAEEEFAALIRHVNYQVKEFSQAILNGEIRIEPAKFQKDTACRYCKYKSVCQFDVLFDDNRFRYIKNLRKDEVLRKITAAGEGSNHG